MDAKEKIRQLRDIISRQLSPLITGDFIYLDLPYYGNIGDSLIWKGASDYFRTLSHKCLHSTDCWNYGFPELPRDCVILLNGGGNFGDLYPQHDDFRKAVVGRYPQHKVIVLPQTVYYEKEENLEADAAFYAGRENVTICTRDTTSYEIVKDKFRGVNVQLVPDMAFFISPDTYRRRIGQTQGRTLYLRRRDKEAVDDGWAQCIPTDAETFDWPTLEGKSWVYKIVPMGIGPLSRFSWAEPLKRRYTDFVWQRILLPYNCRTGMSIISWYDTVYTTRLHTAILSILLERKSIYLLDNNYGKLKSFYETWLKDLENMEYVKADGKE